MASVYVGVSHDNNTVIPCFCDIKILAEPSPNGSNKGTDFFLAKSPVRPCFFYVKYLSAKGQDRLKTPVSGLFGRASCLITLNQEQLTFRRIP